MDSGLYMEGLAIIIFSVIATYYYAYIIKQLASNLNISGTASIKPVLNSTISLIISIYIVLLSSLFLALPTLLEGLTLLLN
jgi:NADH:ubiquinone oxidoreductase subunit 2 (subunit N)